MAETPLYAQSEPWRGPPEGCPIRALVPAPPPSSSASSPQRGRWRCAEAGARVQKAVVIVHKRTVRGAGSSRAPQLGGHWSREQAEALLFSGGAGPLCDGVSVGGQDRPQETGRMSILLPGSPGKRPVVWREGSRCLCPRGGGWMG